MNDISTSVLTRRDPVQQRSIKCLLWVGFGEDKDEKDISLNSRSSQSIRKMDMKKRITLHCGVRKKDV